MAVDKDPTLDMAEKAKLKENLLLLHQVGLYSHLSHNLGLTSSTLTMSPLAPVFYPPGDCVESVLGMKCGTDEKSVCILVFVI